MKNSWLRIIGFIALAACSFAGKAQTDEIVTLKDEIIQCHITREDSVKVFFKIGGNAGATEAFMLRRDIKSIRYAPPQNIPAPKISPDQQIKDTEPVPATAENVSVTPLKTEIKKQNSAHLLIGYALPTGSFAQTESDSGNIRPGLAGQNLQLGFQHVTKKGITIGLQVFAAQNQLNTDPLRSYYKSLVDSTWMAERAVWRAFGIHLTAGYKKEFGDFLLGVRAQGGVTTLIHPEFKLYTNSTNYREYQKATTDGITYGAGLTAGYRLLQDLYIIADISVITGRFNFKEILIQGEEPSSGFINRISQTKRDVKQDYQNLMLNIGVSYRF